MRAPCHSCRLRPATRLHAPPAPRAWPPPTTDHARATVINSAQVQLVMGAQAPPPSASPLTPPCALRAGGLSPWELCTFLSSSVRTRLPVQPALQRALLRACAGALPRFTNQGLACMLWGIARWGFRGGGQGKLCARACVRHSSLCSPRCSGRCCGRCCGRALARCPATPTKTWHTCAYAVVLPSQSKALPHSQGWCALEAA